MPFIQGIRDNWGYSPEEADFPKKSSRNEQQSQRRYITGKNGWSESVRNQGSEREQHKMFRGEWRLTDHCISGSTKQIDLLHEKLTPREKARYNTQALEKIRMSVCPHAPVAQWIEHWTSDPRVGGSTPSGRATSYFPPLKFCKYLNGNDKSSVLAVRKPPSRSYGNFFKNTILSTILLSSRRSEPHK